jgi:hypothetical protein
MHIDEPLTASTPFSTCTISQHQNAYSGGASTSKSRSWCRELRLIDLSVKERLQLDFRLSPCLPSKVLVRLDLVTVMAGIESQAPYRQDSRSSIRLAHVPREYFSCLVPLDIDKSFSLILIHSCHVMTYCSLPRRDRRRQSPRAK